MKALQQILCSAMVVVLVADYASASPAGDGPTPLGTGFTYQGELRLDGAPVNGPTHLRFSLFDAATFGNQIGAHQILANVPVANGLFTVLLNGGGEFGAYAFNGEARWLEIEVCTDPACTSSTILSPRQSLTATPYARYSSGPWETSGGNLSYSSGNVGVGTPLPLSTLDIRGDIRIGIYGVDFATRGRENLVMLRGVVSQAGGIITGTGFSVYHGTVGIYDINFSGWFAAPPTITVTPEYTSFIPLVMTDGVINSDARILIFRTNGVADDAAFHFTAIGPKASGL